MEILWAAVCPWTSSSDTSLAAVSIATAMVLAFSSINSASDNKRFWMFSARSPQMKLSRSGHLVRHQSYTLLQVYVVKLCTEVHILRGFVLAYESGNAQSRKDLGSNVCKAVLSAGQMFVRRFERGFQSLQ